MKRVLVRLQEYAPTASAAEKGVLKILLESPESVVNYSIQQLSAISFTSASTIIRLCKKIGFEGYKEFHKALLYEMALRQVAQKEIKKEIQREDELETITQKIFYKNILSLENSQKLVDYQVLEQCAKLINGARNIAFFGMGASLLVAKDACLKFMRVNKNCYAYDDWHVQWRYAQNLTSEDVAVAISYSGITNEVIQCAKTAAANGAAVIAITRFESSPLSKMAHYSLYVASTEMFLRSGAMSSRISQLTLIDVLFAVYVNQNYDRCIRQISKTHIEKSGGTEATVPDS